MQQRDETLGECIGSGCGKPSTYNNGCRGDECRAAKVAANFRSSHGLTTKRAPASEIAGNPDDPRHGTPNAYVNGHCRCDRCKTAWADSTRTNYVPRAPKRVRSRYQPYVRRKSLALGAIGLSDVIEKPGMEMHITEARLSPPREKSERSGMKFERFPFDPEAARIQAARSI